MNEILYPHYNETRVREIIEANEPDKELVKEGEIFLCGAICFVFININMCDME